MSLISNFYIYFKGAFQDFINNALIHTITIITIALSLLVVGAFGLFFLNVNNVIDSWKQGIRIMAYFDSHVSERRSLDIMENLKILKGINEIKYISKDDAIKYLEKKMKRHKELLNNLRENPLPASLDIQIHPKLTDWNEIEELAIKIENIPEIKEVEYGKGWLNKVTTFIDLFKITCLTIGFILIITTLFIISNTIRLVFYSRKEEIEIMRLIGATNSFIKVPFYLEGIMQGFIGGLFGLAALYLIFISIFSGQVPDWSQNIFQPLFFPFWFSINIIIFSMFIGWVGCYISLKQFIRL